MTARNREWVDFALEHLPGALDVCARTLAQLQTGQGLYREAHWGERGTDPGRVVSVPDYSGGVVDLGALYSVTYDTVKRGDGRSLYEHRFRTPRPILTFATDGSGLVVVRDRSRYSVTPRGIEG